MSYGRFARFWTSSFLADVGDGLRLAAFPLLAARLTPSPFLVGLVVALQGLPWLVLGLGAGSLVDRQDLRRLLLLADGAQALVVLALAAAVAYDAVSLPLLYAAAALAGTCSVLRSSTAPTVIPRLVTGDSLETANGRYLASQIVGGELAGPALGGWLFGIAAALPLAANTGGLGLSVALLLTLPALRPVPPTRPENARSGQRSGVREGLAWLMSDRPVRDLVLTGGLVTLADGAWFAVLVVYVRDRLHGGSGVYGLVLAAGSLGGVAAGLVTARIVARVGHRRTLAGTVAAMAITQAGLVATDNVITASVLLATSSAAFAAFNVVVVTLRQWWVPAPLIGRVTSTYLTVARGCEAAGALMGGGLATVLGVQAPFAVGIVPLLLAAAYLWRMADRPAAA